MLLADIYNDSLESVCYHLRFILIAKEDHSKAQVNTIGYGREKRNWHGRRSRYDLIAIKIILFASLLESMNCSSCLQNTEK